MTAMGGQTAIAAVAPEPAPEIEAAGGPIEALTHAPVGGLSVYIKDPRMMERWCNSAQPGELFYYARIEHLPPLSKAGETARRLSNAQKVTLFQQRRADGTVDYWMRRKAKVRSSPPSRARTIGPRLSADAKRVERYLRTVAQAGGVCPHYATIARICGLRNAEAARYADRQLRNAGLLTSEILDQQSGLRVVTFPGGLTTARPGGAA